ncbi:hypothetical protein P154DRAFT_622080 [Amniculicola lignicola CBS 123094]|uniref:Uncharacterized protein n=1 Tax=Amniculicola lignicola CBS 123094 TaxID=1392246 RepID=A0A6A5W9Q3_9PLEO|nr:hypothetical protein P154DRAFT_622080 [Amniculicola lignicola CBS 123094]
MNTSNYVPHEPQRTDAPSITGLQSHELSSSSRDKTGASLEDLLQEDDAIRLRPRLSKEFGNADSTTIPLPESRSSSSSSISARKAMGDSFPIQSRPRTRAESIPALPTPRRSVTIQDSKGGEDTENEMHEQPPRRKFASVQEYDQLESNPLWYEGQNFSHRYGSSARHDPLLRPPLRSSTLPVELPSYQSQSSRRYGRNSPPLPSSPGSRDLDPHSHATRIPLRIDNTLPSSRSTNEEGSLTRPAFDVQNKTRNGRKVTTILRPPTPPLLPPLRPPVPSSSFLQPPHPLNLSSASVLDTYNHKDQPHTMPHSSKPCQASSPPPLPPPDGSPSPPLIPPSTSPCASSSDHADRLVGVDGPKNEFFREYEQLVRQLMTHMPHLLNVGAEHGYREYSAGEIFPFDLLQTGGLPKRLDHIRFQKEKKDSKTLARQVRKLKLDRVSNVRSRYILVEDLSPRAIAYLGSAFWLNPEFFEEHLNRSGYRDDSYSDPSPRTWNTNATPKDYISVRWWRPVHRFRMKPMDGLERQALLRNELWWDTELPRKIKGKAVRRTTNIFRNEWPIVSDPKQSLLEDVEGTFPSAWEERLTIQVSNPPNKPPVFIVLLDPLPKLSFETQYFPTTSGKVDKQVQIPFTQAYSRAPMGPRLGLIDVFNGSRLDDKAIEILGSNLTSTNCTREDLTSWLTSINDTTGHTDMDMITGLLWIIHRDVIGFLHFVSTALEEIGLGSTDDYLIQKRLAHWRNLITRFQTELPSIRDDIKQFFEFLQLHQSLDTARGFIQHTLNLIDDMIEQNEKSYSALRQDMALLESQRAIDQAESVGKLTELGFILYQ